MGQRCVPDASVILKWILPPDNEPHADTTRDLRDSYVRGDCDPLVPSLWLFEVGNILSLNFPAHVGAMLDAIHALEMPIFEGDTAWLSMVLRLVATDGVAFCDASYRAAALETQSVLVSADASYLRRAEGAGAACFLGDWAAP